MSLTLKLSLDGRDHEVSIDGDTANVDGHTFTVLVEGRSPSMIVLVDGLPHQVEVLRVDGPHIRVRVGGSEHDVQYGRGQPAVPPAPQVQAPRPSVASAGSVTAPMAGRIIRLAVEAGTSVESGDLLLILEAMKMENEIRAPVNGQVAEVHVTPGQRVAEGAALVTLA
jgi:biotin carboxyl carrier protein